MQFDPHARAQFLIDEALAAGIAPDDGHWLHRHIEECAECSGYAELTAQIVRGLNAISFQADPAMTARVQNSLALRAQSRYRTAPAWRWAAIAAALLIALAAPVYQKVTERRRAAEMEREDTLLLERVRHRVAQTLPEAMEPLVRPGGDR
jgi:predicted anti-sigma-YlaC factor YlaD